MDRRGKSCTACVRIRAFLVAATALILAIYLQPGWALRLAGVVPGPLMIGLGMCALGGAVFAVRYSAYRKAARRASGPGARSSRRSAFHTD